MRNIGLAGGEVGTLVFLYQHWEPHGDTQTRDSSQPLPVSQQPVSSLTSYWLRDLQLFSVSLWTVNWEWKHTERQPVTVREEWRHTVTPGHRGPRLNGKYGQCWGCQFSRASWHYTVTLADCYELSLPNITLIKSGRYQDKKSSTLKHTDVQLIMINCNKEQF